MSLPERSPKSMKKHESCSPNGACFRKLGTVRPLVDRHCIEKWTVWECYLYRYWWRQDVCTYAIVFTRLPCFWLTGVTYQKPKQRNKHRICQAMNSQNQLVDNRQRFMERPQYYPSCSQISLSDKVATGALSELKEGSEKCFRTRRKSLLDAERVFRVCRSPPGCH